MYEVTVRYTSPKFTYHVVNIKPQLGLCLSFLAQKFTYHVVNIKLFSFFNLFIFLLNIYISRS